MTKILTVTGADGEDYAAAEYKSFYNADEKMAHYAEAMKNGGELEVRDPNEECTYLLKAYEFPDVPEGFIKLMRDKQDYDDSKHSDWLVLTS